MKRINLLLLFMLVIAGITQTHAQDIEIWDGSTADAYAGGDGTEANPYLISNGGQLAYFKAQVEAEGSNYYKGKYVKLTQDIYLNDTTGWESWDENTAVKTDENSTGVNKFTPISRFDGTFDGNGKAIKGLYIKSTSSSIGFIRDSYGNIKNLAMEEGFVYANQCVGAIVGWMYDGTIENCSNAANVKGRSFVGGLAGYGDTAFIKINMCFNIGTVTATNGFCAGGIMGAVVNAAITNCYNTGNITAKGAVGGIIGQLNGLLGQVFKYKNDNLDRIENSYNLGVVTSNDTQIGGIIGYGHAKLSNCFYLVDNDNKYAGNGFQTLNNYNDKQTEAMAVTKNEFKNGYVCRMLNNMPVNGVTWYQNIDNGQTTDDYPVWDNTHGKVYATAATCPRTFTTLSNTGPETGIPGHVDNYEDGRCDICGYVVRREPQKSGDVYQISKRAELFWFSDLVAGKVAGRAAEPSANAVLTKDIVLNTSHNSYNIDWEIRKGEYGTETNPLISMLPIGTNTNPYTGTFDGNGYTIKGLFIDEWHLPSNHSLFGNIGENGVVRNLNISESMVEQNAVIAGYNAGTIENCHCTKVLMNSYASVGGIVWENAKSGKVINCSFTQESSTQRSYISKRGSASMGFPKNALGGIVAINSGTVEKCYVGNSVMLENKRSRTIEQVSMGGIVGRNTATGVVSNCYFRGYFRANNDLGGIAGENNGTIKNCYSTATHQKYNSKIDVENDFKHITCKGEGTATNCYYLPITSDDGSTTTESTDGAKTADAFKSGEVAWLLQNGQDEEIWGQWLPYAANETVPADICPVWQNETNKVHKLVYKVAEDNEETYYKHSKNFTVREAPAASDAAEDIFTGWFTQNFMLLEDNDELTSDYLYLTPYWNATIYDLTVEATTGGTAGESGTYLGGKGISITATPDETYDFYYWSFEGSSLATKTDATVGITLTSNTTATANFKLKSYTVSINTTTGQEHMGSVKTNVVSGGKDGNNYNHGTTIKATATPNHGYTFLGWSDGVTEAEREFTVTGDITLIATFKESGSQTGTAIDDAAAASFKAYGTQGAICISGAQADVTILSLSGATVYKGMAQKVQMPKGIYIVYSQGTAQKVIVK